MASTYDQIACTRLYVVGLVGKAFIFHASTFESYWKWRSKAKGNVHNFSSIQQYLMIREKSWVGVLLEQFLRLIKRNYSYFVPILAAVRTIWKVDIQLGGQGGSEGPGGPDSRRSERFERSGWSGRFRRSDTSMRSESSWRSSMSCRSWRSAKSGR